MDSDHGKRLTWLGHAAQVLKKTKHARHYAIGDAELLALGALLCEWTPPRGLFFTHGEAATFLEELRPYAPSLFQQRPPDEVEPPELAAWKDEVSGQMPRNPWSKDSPNLSDQMFLRKHAPALADYLKRVAEQGLTFEALHRKREQKEARDKLRKLPYGEREHAENLRLGANLTKLSEFRRVHGDLVSDFYDRERSQAVTLPWLGERNLTVMMRMQRENPELRSVIDRSLETARAWAQAEISESEKTAAEALSRQRAAEAVLKSRGVPTAT